MLTLLTIGYLCAFQFCAVPAAYRLIKRRSSADLSTWREWLILAGITLQLGVMLQTGAAWQVVISPILSGVNVSVLLVLIYRYR